MKSILVFLTCFLSLSVFYSCGDTEYADVPNLITKTEGYTFTDTPDETWIRVSDDYIAELMELELPPNFESFESIKDSKLRKKYHHMLILKQFGDIPQVRTVIEYELNLPNPHPNPYTVRLIPGDKESIAHLEREIIYLEALVFLWPLAEGTQKALEHTKKLKLHFSVDMDKLMKEDPELFVQIQRDHFIESFGDIPEVHTYTKILLKLMLEEPITDEERGAYLKAMNHLFNQQ
ncbi:hypothetical protein F4167_05405 [Candidatus Poribacteria bacterium]|nr:hypothetical protein [Candidatus Poribacteria bacterium]